MLAKLPLWLFKKGSIKHHFVYEKLGNYVQDIRSKLQ